MIVDVITDASFCPINKFGTFAYYIKSKSGTIAANGILRKAGTPMEAEIMTIANAIHVLKGSSINRGDIEYIRIYSDCLNTFQYIKRKTKHPVGKLIIQNILKMKSRSNHTGPINLFYNLRHIKAHTDLEDHLSLGNRYCHDMAYQMLQVHREKINYEKNNNQSR